MHRRSAVWFRSRLSRGFGPPDAPGGEPLEILVTTILSQNATDANRDRAYASSFVASDPSSASGKPAAGVAEAIRPVDFGRRRARSQV
jgi:endonuclease III